MRWWGWWRRDEPHVNGTAARELEAARSRLAADRRRRPQVQRAADQLGAAIEQALRGGAHR